MTDEETMKSILDEIEYGYIGYGNLHSDDDQGLKLIASSLMKQIPQPVEYTMDRSWGVEKKRPACPVCGYYLTPFSFLGTVRRITYCENCGQAVDLAVE